MNEEIWCLLPKELTNIILDYSGKIVCRGGIYINRIMADDPRAIILDNWLKTRIQTVNIEHAGVVPELREMIKITVCLNEYLRIYIKYVLVVMANGNIGYTYYFHKRDYKEKYVLSCYSGSQWIACNIDNFLYSI